MRVYYKILPFLLVCCSISLTAQSFITLKGRLQSNEHYYNKPLPKAEVFVKNTSIRTMTNEDGRFVLHIPDSLNADTIIFRKPGLTPIVKNLFNIPRNKDIDYVFQYVTFKEKEVLTTTEEPITIVKKAMQAVKQNYIIANIISENSFSYTLTENNKLNKSLHASALVNTNTKGGTIQILEPSMFLDTTTSIHLHPTTFNVLEYLQPTYNKPFLKDIYSYDIILRRVYPFEGSMLYEFKFEQKIKNGPSVYSGSFAIDYNSYAFVWFDIQITYNRPAAQENKLFFKGVNYITKNSLLSEHIRVDYRQFGKQWFPIYLSKTINYQTIGSGNSFNKLCDASFQFVFTNHYKTAHYLFSSAYSLSRFPEEQGLIANKPLAFFNTVPLSLKQETAHASLTRYIVPVATPATSTSPATVAPAAISPVVTPNPIPTAESPIAATPSVVDSTFHATPSTDTAKTSNLPTTTAPSSASIDSLLNSMSPNHAIINTSTTPPTTPVETIAPVVEPTPPAQETITPSAPAQDLPVAPTTETSPVKTQTELDKELEDLLKSIETPATDTTATPNPAP